MPGNQKGSNARLLEAGRAHLRRTPLRLERWLHRPVSLSQSSKDMQDIRCVTTFVGDRLRGDFVCDEPFSRSPHFQFTDSSVPTQRTELCGSSNAEVVGVPPNLAIDSWTIWWKLTPPSPEYGQPSGAGGVS